MCSFMGSSYIFGNLCLRSPRHCAATAVDSGDTGIAGPLPHNGMTSSPVLTELAKAYVSFPASPHQGIN